MREEVRNVRSLIRVQGERMSQEINEYLGIWRISLADDGVEGLSRVIGFKSPCARVIG